MWPNMLPACGYKSIARRYSDNVTTEPNECIGTDNTQDTQHSHTAQSHSKVEVKWTVDIVYCKQVDSGDHAAGARRTSKLLCSGVSTALFDAIAIAIAAMVTCVLVCRLLMDRYKGKIIESNDF